MSLGVGSGVQLERRSSRSRDIVIIGAELAFNTVRRTWN